MVRRLAVTVVLVAGLAACSDDPPPQAAPAPATTTASPTPSPTPTPAPKPPPKPAPAVNPLTGLRGVPTNPVIAVKIDDTASGRPQIGLEQADIVYVEQVEGGATRLAAVFASRLPGTVGPVRSVRNMDPQLLGAYGRPALAYSGGAALPVRKLRASPLVDAGPQRRGGSYRRLGSRPAPYNLVADLRGLARSVGGGVSRPKDIGLDWAASSPLVTSARKATSLSVNVGRVRQAFRWDGRHWVRLDPQGRVIRTASGQAEKTKNVVIQFSPVRLDPTNVDVTGTPSAFTTTVGRGRLLVFRNGRAISGLWLRSSAAGGTRYIDSRGRPLPLDPGGAWVLLADQRTGASYR